MTDGSALRDTDIGRLAELVAMVGAAGLLTLVLLYAIEVPRGGPYVFGTTNDVLGGIYNLALVPLLLLLARGDGADVPGRTVTRVAALASAVGAASSFLLVARVIDLVASASVSVLALVVQCIWLLAFGLRDDPRHPSGVRRLARVAGGGVLIALPVAGLAFLLPKGSPVQLGLYVVAGVIGGAGWIAIPLFWHAVGRRLRTAGRGAGRLG